MTYHFLCKLFNSKIAAWITVLWFAFLFIAMFALSAYREDAFLYLNFK